MTTETKMTTDEMAGCAYRLYCRDCPLRKDTKPGQCSVPEAIRSRLLEADKMEERIKRLTDWIMEYVYDEDVMGSLDKYHYLEIPLERDALVELKAALAERRGNHVGNLP
jgi:hypothetical protein